MFALKPISRDSIDGALARAERYRLLNEPHEAESICRDILEVDPTNRQARISLVLALTDEIPQESGAFAGAMEAMSSLETEYDRTYYSGIAWERRAKASYAARAVGTNSSIYMTGPLRRCGSSSEAEHLRPAGNDDAVLRWNACVRFLDRHKELGPAMEEASDLFFPSKAWSPAPRDDCFSDAANSVLNREARRRTLSQSGKHSRDERCDSCRELATWSGNERNQTVGDEPLWQRSRGDVLA